MNGKHIDCKTGELGYINSMKMLVSELYIRCRQVTLCVCVCVYVWAAYNICALSVVKEQPCDSCV